MEKLQYLFHTQAKFDVSFLKKKMVSKGMKTKKYRCQIHSKEEEEN